MQPALQELCATMPQSADTFAGFKRRGILLIDDDDSFCHLMEVVARASAVPLTAVAALEDLPSLGSLRDFDLIIVDYNLAAFTGLEIAEYVDAFFGSLPVMMVSIENLENESGQRWPISIRKFVNKAFGPFAILQRALKLLEEVQDEGFASVGFPQPAPAAVPASSDLRSTLVSNLQ